MSRERLKLLFKQHCEPVNGTIAVKVSAAPPQPPLRSGCCAGQLRGPSPVSARAPFSCSVSLHAAPVAVNSGPCLPVVVVLVSGLRGDEAPAVRTDLLPVLPR